MKKITSNEKLNPNINQPVALCPYCKQPLESTTANTCPHCELPIRRRKRQKTSGYSGSIAKIVIHQHGEQKEYALLKQIATVGRHSDNTIVIKSPYISKHHAKIEFTDEIHTITDLDSTNGTRVNGQILRPNQVQPLANNDIIRVSDVRGNSIKITYIASAKYKWVDSNRAGQSYQLEDEVSHIGRGFDTTIVLPHPAVAWYHAKITKSDQNHFVIEDVSAHSNTFVNGNLLETAQPVRQGDVIGIGPFNLIYQGNGKLSSFIAERNFNIEAANLNKVVYSRNWLGFSDKQQAKQILHNVDIDINPREFVALVGSSGGGKSTLMKALIGLSPATSGTVLINGDNLYEHLDIYSHLIGYVPQDDIIHQDLPVQQVLNYAFQLRVPHKTGADGKQLINDILEKVGLTQHANTIIKDLSGGQRKRVSIAAELLADPWIFFLDEPTSGLDPGLEKLMMDTLRHLADEGRTIVLVTHAINHIIDHCDQVVFMAHGELAYFGPPEEVIDYFEANSFPDIYTALAQPTSKITPSKSPTKATTWGEQYRQSKQYQTYIVHRKGGEVAHPITKKDVPSSEGIKQQFQQFKVLSQRYLALIKADRLTLWLLLAVMPLVAALLLLITNSNALTGNSTEEIVMLLEQVGSYTIATDTQRLLFLIALAPTLLGIFGAGYEIIKENSIYRRERMVNLEVFPYFASKFVVLGLFMAIQMGLFLGLLTLGVSMPNAGAITWAPLEYYITLLLTVFASIALGLFISASVSSRDMVTYLIFIIILAQIILSGATFQLSTLTEPLSYLTITRWSLEALGISTDIESLNALGQVRVENVVDTGRGQTILVKDIPTTIEFFVNYGRNSVALLSRWIFLMAHIAIWGYLTMWQLHRKDEI